MVRRSGTVRRQDWRGEEDWGGGTEDAEAGDAPGAEEADWGEGYWERSAQGYASVPAPAPDPACPCLLG